MRQIAGLFSVILLIFFVNTSVSFAESKSVDYALPYPGLLPDNPLYFLKVSRDRIVSFLISDSLKKAEFDLLQADKRISAALYLFNSTKKNQKTTELIISTTSKAENYLEQSITKIREAKKEGKDTADLLRRLKDAVRKHSEVLKMLNITSEAQRVKVFQQEVDNLSPH